MLPRIGSTCLLRCCLMRRARSRGKVRAKKQQARCRNRQRYGGSIFHVKELLQLELPMSPRFSLSRGRFCLIGRRIARKRLKLYGLQAPRRGRSNKDVFTVSKFTGKLSAGKARARPVRPPQRQRQNPRLLFRNVGERVFPTSAQLGRLFEERRRKRSS